MLFTWNEKEESQLGFSSRRRGSGLSSPSSTTSENEAGPLAIQDLLFLWTAEKETGIVSSWIREEGRLKTNGRVKTWEFGETD